MPGYPERVARDGSTMPSQQAAADGRPAPLAELRVLDLSEGIAGPFCTKYLGAMGADVIKVERPRGGDVARSRPPFVHDEPHPERSGLFLYLNTSKRSVTLDIEQAAGRELLRGLLGWAHVLVESFRPGQLASWGLDYASLEGDYPSLVFVSLSDFGQDGPYRDYQGSDLTALALGGLLFISGSPDREPLRIGGEPTQYLAGLGAFSAALIAVHHMEATGEGQHVDVSAFESVAVAQEYAGLTYGYTGELRQRVNEFAPLFEVSDGRLGLMYRQPNWADFCVMIERPELVDDPRFATLAGRRQNVAELNEIVEPWMRGQRKAELYHRAQAQRMPVGYVCDARDLLESEQYRHRGYFVEIDHPVAGRLTYPGMPLHMGDHAWTLTRAPLLGEHNEDVYRGELGLSSDELRRLRDAGIV